MRGVLRSKFIATRAGFDRDGRMLRVDCGGLEILVRSGLKRAGTGCYADPGAVLQNRAK